MSSNPSFEEFKNGLSSIEKRILNEQVNELSDDFRAILTWLRYVQETGRTQAEIDFFYDEFLPKALRTVVNRRYNGSKMDRSLITEFLQESIAAIAKTLHRNSQVLNSVLCEVFDPYHPFYRTYFQNKQGASASMVASAGLTVLAAEGVRSDEKSLHSDKGDIVGEEFFDCLDEESWVDCLRISKDSSSTNTRRWEAASIKMFSDYRTEVQVAWQDESTVWLSLETDRHRFAPAFTMSIESPQVDAAGEKPGDNSDSVVPNGTIVHPRREELGNITSGKTEPMAGSEGESKGCLSSFANIADTPWKQALLVGDLVDACDRSDVWYQATVMDIARSEDNGPRVAVVDTLRPRAASQENGAISSTKNDCGQMQLTKNDPKIKESSNSSFALSEFDNCSGVEGAVTHSLGVYTDDGNESINHDHDEDCIAAAGYTPANKQTFLRIAFVGLSERHDEWIDLESERIQQLNTRSFGKRGTDYNLGNAGLTGKSGGHFTSNQFLSEDSWSRTSDIGGSRGCCRDYDSNIREEVLFMANLRTLKGTPGADALCDAEGSGAEIDHYATFREASFVEPIFVHLINCFGAHGGFDAVMAILQAHACDISYSAEEKLLSGSSRGQMFVEEPLRSPSSVVNQAVPVSPIVSNVVVNSQNVMPLIVSIGKLHRVLSKSFLASLCPAFLNLSSAFLRRLSLSDIREISVQTVVEPTLHALENIAYAHFGRNAAAGEIVEPLTLSIAIRFLSCPYLNRRLGGLHLLAELLRRARNTQPDCATGMRVIRTTPSVDEPETRMLLKPFLGDVSFRVVRVLFYLDASKICARLAPEHRIGIPAHEINGADAFLGVFVGASAHVSLIARVGVVLEVMAATKCMSTELLTALCLASGISILDNVRGSIAEQLNASPSPEAVSALVDVIAHLHADALNRLINICIPIHVRDGKVPKDGPTGITEDLVNVVGAIVLRCRQLLMMFRSTDENYRLFIFRKEKADSSIFAIESRDAEVYDDALKASIGAEETPPCSFIAANIDIYSTLELVFDTHQIALFALWRWATGAQFLEGNVAKSSRLHAEVSDAVSLKSLERIEAAINISTSTASSRNTGCGGISNQNSIISSSGTDEEPILPWAMHWLLWRELLITTICSIQKSSSSSLLPSLRVLHLFICSWRFKVSDPRQDSNCDGRNELSLSKDVISCSEISQKGPLAISMHFTKRKMVGLPFEFPNRGDLVEYLERRFSITLSVCRSVVNLKSRFVTAALPLLKEHQTGNVLRHDAPSRGSVFERHPPHVQIELRTLRIDDARAPFLAQLEKMLDFLHMFVRCSSTLLLSKAIVSNIWRAVLFNDFSEASNYPSSDQPIERIGVLLAEEADIIFGFMSRIIIKVFGKFPNDVESAGATKLAQKTCNEVNAQDTHIEAPPSMPATVRRNAVCSSDTIRWIFDHLMCDGCVIQGNHGEDKADIATAIPTSVVSDASPHAAHWKEGDAGLIASEHFSVRAFECFEKWFKFTNARAGLISECLNDKTIPFSIKCDPSALIGLDVFSDIIFCARSCAVATKSVKFITTLPLCCSPAFASCSWEFRRKLLKKCFQQLQKLKQRRKLSRDLKCTNQGGASLGRVLLYLDGVLEESFASSIAVESVPSSRSSLCVSPVSSDVSIYSRHNEFTASRKRWLLAPHGCLGRGLPILFNISSTSRRLKAFVGTITVYSSDSVLDLMHAVAVQLQCRIGDIKVFRRGKEISTAEFKKPVSRMKFLADRETLVVGERPNAVAELASQNITQSNFCGPRLPELGVMCGQTSKDAIGGMPEHVDVVCEENDQSDDATKGAHISPESTENIETDVVVGPSELGIMHDDAQSNDLASKEPVAIVIANSPEYFELLFGLLEFSNESECDHLWNLIVMLPTPASLLRDWLLLDCDDVYDYLLQFSHPAESSDGCNIRGDKIESESVSGVFGVSFARLLYRLQLVEVLLQPAPTPTSLESQREHLQLLDLPTISTLGCDTPAHPTIDYFELLKVWPHRFFAKGGLKALCSAFDFICDEVEAFWYSHYVALIDSSKDHGSAVFLNNKQPKAMHGKSLVLVQSALSLVTKLVNASVLRYSSSSDLLTAGIQDSHRALSIPADQLSIRIDRAVSSEVWRYKAIARFLSTVRSKKFQSSSRNEKLCSLGNESSVESSSAGIAMDNFIGSLVENNRLQAQRLVRENVALEMGDMSQIIGDSVQRLLLLARKNSFDGEWGWGIRVEWRKDSFSAALDAMSSEGNETRQISRLETSLQLLLGVNFSKLQCATLRMMVLVRKIADLEHHRCLGIVSLGRVESFDKSLATGGVDDKSLKSTAPTSSFGTDAILAMLDDLLILWASITIMQPTQLERISLRSAFDQRIAADACGLLPEATTTRWKDTVDTDQFIRELLLGHYCLSIPSAGSENSGGRLLPFALPASVSGIAAGNWLSVALREFVNWRTSWSGAFSIPGGSTSNLPDSFRSAVLQSLLKNRPSLIAIPLFSSPPNKSTCLHSSSASTISASFPLKDDTMRMAPLFKIASAMFVDTVESESMVPLAVLLSACETIVRELKALAEIKRTNAEKLIGSTEILEGTLKLLFALSNGCHDVTLMLARDERVVFFLRSCLGFDCRGTDQSAADTLADIEHFIELCTLEATRKPVYSLLLRTCEHEPQNATFIFRVLESVHDFLSPPTVQLRQQHSSVAPVLAMPAEVNPWWDCKPESESISADAGYVGLRNLGSTCYMNSLLQILFMNIEVCDYILTQIPVIDNCGEFRHVETCLSDSHGLGDVSDNVGGIFSVAFQESETQKNDLLLQLKKVFMNLRYSQCKAYSPYDWAFAFKDEYGINPTDVNQQQDAQEFFQMLCQRFELAIKHYNERLKQNARQQKEEGKENNEQFNQTAFQLRDIFQQSFGGKLCNQMFPTSAIEETLGGSETAGATRMERRKLKREMEESFVCISLDVKGCGTLTRSLSKFVEGEQISDYRWEIHPDSCETNPGALIRGAGDTSDSAKKEVRINITKRQCISELSDTLIFHLKRFELNFDTFRREKLNDAFSFPQFLDMLPYTKEGLYYLEEGLGCASPTLDPAHGDHTAAMSSSDRSYPPFRASEYYKFELVGVVVHTGTSDSGHYYSYIKERKTDINQPSTFPSNINADKVGSTVHAGSRWLEFNDSEVSIFSEERIEAECFGGTTIGHEYFPSSQTFCTSEIVNTKSAYMLIYRRCHPCSACATAKGNNSALATRFDCQLHNLRQSIRLANAVHAMSVRVLSESHLKFFHALVLLLRNEYGRSSSVDQFACTAVKKRAVLYGEVLASSVWFATQYMLRTPHAATTISLCNDLLTMMKQYQTNTLTVSVLTLAAQATLVKQRQQRLQNDLLTNTQLNSADVIDFSSPEEDSTDVSTCESFVSIREHAVDRTTLVAESRGLLAEEQTEQTMLSAVEPRLGISAAAAIDTRSMCDLLPASDPSFLVKPPLPSQLLLHKFCKHGIRNSVLLTLLAPREEFRLKFAELLFSALSMSLSCTGFPSSSEHKASIAVAVIDTPSVSVAKSGHADLPLPAVAALLNSSVSIGEGTISDVFREQIAAADSLPVSIHSFVNEETVACPPILYDKSAVPSTVDDGDGDDYEADLELAIRMSQQMCSSEDSDGHPGGDSNQLKALDFSAVSSVPPTVTEKTHEEEATEDPVGEEQQKLTTTFSPGSNNSLGGITPLNDRQPSLGLIDNSAFQSGAMEDHNETAVYNEFPSSNSSKDSSTSQKQSEPETDHKTSYAIDVGLAAKMLQELTSHAGLCLIPENWRHSNGYAHLLLLLCGMGLNDNQNVHNSGSGLSGTTTVSMADEILSVENRVGAAVRGYFIQRELIAEIVDIILGDQSPLCGSLYTNASRKRAPSSYVYVGYRSFAPHIIPNENSSQRSAAQNIPDWTTLLSVLSILVRSCPIDLGVSKSVLSECLPEESLICSSASAPSGHAQQTANKFWNFGKFSSSFAYSLGHPLTARSASSPRHASNPVADATEVKPENESSEVMHGPTNAIWQSPIESMASVWDEQCVRAKTLYSTLFRQARYMQSAIEIFSHLALNNLPFSNMISEAIYEELSLCTAETTSHIFSAIDGFLSIRDRFAGIRAHTLFNGSGVGPDLLHLLFTMRDQPLRSRFVCVGIRSFVLLCEKHPVLRETLTGRTRDFQYPSPDVFHQGSTKISMWAPWMLRFCFRYIHRLTKERSDLSIFRATTGIGRKSGQQGAAGATPSAAAIAAAATAFATSSAILPNSSIVSRNSDDIDSSDPSIQSPDFIPRSFRTSGDVENVNECEDMNSIHASTVLPAFATAASSVMEVLVGQEQGDSVPSVSLGADTAQNNIGKAMEISPLHCIEASPASDKCVEGCNTKAIFPNDYLFNQVAPLTSPHSHSSSLPIVNSPESVTNVSALEGLTFSKVDTRIAAGAGARAGLNLPCAFPLPPPPRDVSPLISTDKDIESKVKGPYVLVYGESEWEHELSWYDRADATFESLQALLRVMGENPELLIPEDSFFDDSDNNATKPFIKTSQARGIVTHPIDLTGADKQSSDQREAVYENSTGFYPSTDISAVQTGISENSAGEVGIEKMLHDGMTDQELARLLASGDLNIELC